MPTTYFESSIPDVSILPDSYNQDQPIDIVEGDALRGVIGDTFFFGDFPPDLSDSAALNLEAGATYTFTLTGTAPETGVDIDFGLSDLNAPVVNATGAFSTTLTYTASSTQTQDLFVQIDGPIFGGMAYTITLTDVVLPVPTEGDDVLIGSATADQIDLLGGDDAFSAGGGSDNVVAGAGNDTVNGDGGNDVVSGGDGADDLQGGNGRDTLSGDAGDDLLDGGNQQDDLSGGDGNDTLLGGKGDDTLLGDAGDDVLNGSTGNDLATGGAGADTFVVRKGDGQDTIGDFTQGEDLIDLSATGIWDISQLGLQDIGADVRINTGGSNYVELRDITAGQLSNADFILAAEPIVVATGGGDVLVGTQAADTYLAGGGADRVTGLGGDDTLDGGNGQDTVDGGAGNDVLSGGSGKDQIKGGDGNDVIDGGSDNDKLEGGDGDDTLDGGNANDRLYGDAGADMLIGENGNDRLWGGTGDDTLDGGAGKDQMIAGDGNDVLIGGWGDDALTGGAGADVFVFADDRTRADTITDFEIGIDTIQIASYGFTDIADLTLSQVGSATVITLSQRDSITIENTALGDLTNADFDLLV